MELRAMRKGVMVSVFVWLSTAILVFADSWVWNASERPAVSLDMALRRSEVLLGEDAETFYCVRAGLVGGQDKGEGAWNLRFVAVDGSQKNTGDCRDEWARHRNFAVRPYRLE